MIEHSEILRERYETIALSGDKTTTASDFHLRNLEISYGAQFIRDGDTLLDVGCGPAVALEEYAQQYDIKAYGIDYAENMVNFARKRLKDEAPNLNVDIKQASVVELPYENNFFNVVTSHRCLMALLDWELQKKAILEIHRVLKPGGIFIMMEGTFDGLERLNFYRRKFELAEIDSSGKDRLLTLKFHERQLHDFIKPYFKLQRTQRFGMYYFLTRIIQPLLEHPNPPRYDHPLNNLAQKICQEMPDFEGMGHLVGFSFRKTV